MRTLLTMCLMVSLAVVASRGAHAADLIATIRDFRTDHPDFEEETGDDRGMVETQLGGDKKPVYAGNPDTPTTSGRDAFDQWYRDVPGVNQSTTLVIPLTDQGGGLLGFSSSSFFPIDGLLQGNEGNDHNFHFTTEIHGSFTYLGGETFTFTGDDDVFVFINDTLALDLGGVHGAETASIDVDALGLTVGQTYDIDMFHAERHLTQSNFQLTTSIVIEPSEGEGEGEGEPDPNDLGDGFLDFEDVDGDGIPDGCVVAAEGGVVCPDGVVVDDLDGDGTPDDFDSDRDGDGTADVDDDDLDGDGTDNAADDDLDGDGVADDVDLDVDGDRTPNGNDLDVDGDGTANDGDDDIDGDGAANDVDTDDDGDGTMDGSDVDANGDGQADPIPDPSGPPDGCGCGAGTAADVAMAGCLAALLARRRRR